MKTSLPILTVGYRVRESSDGLEIEMVRKRPTPKAIKRGVAGSRIGFGGGLEEGEKSITASFSREFMEESGLKADKKDISIMARVRIDNTEKPSLMLYFLLIRNTFGNLRLNEEIEDPRWYSIDRLPEKILGVDVYILPRILKGERLVGRFLYNGKMEVLEHDLYPVDSLSDEVGG